MSSRPTRNTRPANSSRPAGKPVRKTATRPVQAAGPVRQPRKLPFLEAVCKKLNQRINLDDEQRLLGLYERGWIFRGVLANLEGDEARYVRALATRYNSWIARQVA